MLKLGDKTGCILADSEAGEKQSGGRARVIMAAVPNLLSGPQLRTAKQSFPSELFNARCIAPRHK